MARLAARHGPLQHVIGARYLGVGVREQRHGGVVLRRGRVELAERIGRDAAQLHPQRTTGRIGLQIYDLLPAGRSASRPVKVQQHRLAARVVGQCNRATARGRQREGWR